MNGYDRINQLIRDPNLRASDADREATADRLRQSHAEGRIDSEEFQERLDRCFAAKTGGQLAELTRDLPLDPSQRGSLRGAGFGGLGPLRMIPIVPIILALIAIHAILGLGAGMGRGAFFPFFLIPLLILARLTIFRCGWRRWGSRRGSSL